MELSTFEIIKENPILIRIFKEGGFEKLLLRNVVPAGIDPSTGVTSKDVIFSPEPDVFARLYIPKTINSHHKLPLLFFYHGGAFVIESADSAIYHDFLNLVVSESNVIAVSVNYRLAPKFPLPAAYDDSWDAIKWAAEHVNGNGPEPWLNEFADHQNVFLSGDSAGGNIAHHMAIRAGLNAPSGLGFHGAILLHPFFWGKERLGNESLQPEVVEAFDYLWAMVHPGANDMDDPYINPGMDPRVADMGVSKMLVCLAEYDIIIERGWYYKEVIEKSGWKGDLEVVEDKGEEHVFFLFDPSGANARTLRHRVSTFISEA